jgi:hypothetical protein
MDRWQLRVLAVVAGLMVLGSSGAGEAARVHTGQVVDFDRGTPLDGASTNAYGTQDRDEKGDTTCPTYKERLSADKSNAAGAFRFIIDRPVYVATYCKPGFQPRVERDNKSERDGQPIQPAPIKLMPLSADASAYRAIVAHQMSAFLADLRYLQQARPDQFREALREASEKSLRDPFFAERIEHMLMLEGRDRR